MIKRIKISTGSCGLAACAAEVYDFFKENIRDIDIVGVGCIGHCYAEPIVGRSRPITDRFTTTALNQNRLILTKC